MAITNFIGEVWAAQILQALQKALVYGQAGVINRDYEGDIKGKGDTVRITAHGPITIDNYDKSTGLSDPEELDDASTTLEITQAKSFNFRIEDVDKAQMNVKLMESATRDAAYRLAEDADGERHQRRGLSARRGRRRVHRRDHGRSGRLCCGG